METAEATNPDLANPKKTTSSDICLALRERYPSGSHALFYEVSNDVGFRGSRWIDAVGVGIWPSTGQEVHGIEIKVSRSDWKRELAEPAKAQELMRFCNRWFLACPEGVVTADEVPETWGLLVIKDGKIREARKAPRLSPEPLTKGFICSLLRRAGQVDADVVASAVAKANAAVRAEIDKKVAEALAYEKRMRSHREEETLSKIATIERLAGVPITDWNLNAETFGLAIKLLMGSGVQSAYCGLDNTLKVLDEAASRIRRAAETLGVNLSGGAS